MLYNIYFLLIKDDPSRKTQTMPYIKCPFWLYYRFKVKLLRMGMWFSPVARQPAEGFTLPSDSGRHYTVIRNIFGSRIAINEACKYFNVLSQLIIRLGCCYYACFTDMETKVSGVMWLTQARITWKGRSQDSASYGSDLIILTNAEKGQNHKSQSSGGEEADDSAERPVLSARRQSASRKHPGQQRPPGHSVGSFRASLIPHVQGLDSPWQHDKFLSYFFYTNGKWAT